MTRRLTGIVLIITVLIVVTGCQSPRSKAVKNIENFETSIFDQNGMVDRTKVGELIDLYIGFADNFSADTLAPIYLFKAADMAMNTNRSLQAIQLYERIIEQYSGYAKAPEALFLQGYVYENNLNRLDKAEEIYKKFIELYPDNDFADDAEVSLQYLGKTPEELIEIFQQQSESAAVKEED